MAFRRENISQVEAFKQTELFIFEPTYVLSTQTRVVNIPGFAGRACCPSPHNGTEVAVICGNKWLRVE